MIRSTATRIAIAVTAMTTVLAIPAAAADVTITGGGLGHGIGMSQWGAQAMAQNGSNHEQILQHFYTGAQFGQVGSQFTSHAEPLHIGLSQNALSTSFRPIGGNVTVTHAGQIHIAAAGETWSLQSDGLGTCSLYKNSVLVPSGTTCDGGITWAGQPDVRVHFPGLGRTYARGEIVFKPTGGKFHLVAVLPLETYLYGLGEVPNSWHIEALRAQAIAARTYALYKAYLYRVAPRSDCGCHLLPTTADQVYRGWDTASNLTEAGASGTQWRAAVDSTAGKAMWHSWEGSGRALEAYYFSSTGDNTENSEDKWNYKPYLRSVNDPGARAWSPPERTFTYASFAIKLGFDLVTWVEIPERFASGRPKRIDVQGTIGGSQQTISFSSAAFLDRVGLPSQWIWSVQGFVPPGADKAVLHNPNTGQWSYRNADGSLTSIFFGTPGDRAFMGDWDCDGVDTPGLYRISNGYAYLRNSNTQGFADLSFYFGIAGDIPVAGDFDGDGCDTVSIYRPSEARFYVTNRLGSADQGFVADYSFLFGVQGDTPFMGDWDGDGVDTPGLRRPSNGFVYLRNSNTQGFADLEFFYGVGGDVVFSGDWDADSRDSIGLYRPSNGTIYLRNSLTTGNADITFPVGTGMQPAAGEL